MSNLLDQIGEVETFGKKMVPRVIIYLLLNEGVIYIQDSYFGLYVCGSTIVSGHCIIVSAMNLKVVV